MVAMAAMFLLRLIKFGLQSKTMLLYSQMLKMSAKIRIVNSHIATERHKKNKCTI